METIDSAIVLLNQWGRAYCDFAGRMLLQSSVLVGLLLLADRYLRTRVCARFRYAMWLLVPLKLVLPPSLALPTGLAYWLGRYWPAAPAASESPAFAPSWAMEQYVAPLRDLVALPAAPMDATTEMTIAPRQMMSLQWPGLLLLGWVVVVLVLLALILWQLMSVHRGLSRSRPAGTRMVALLAECCADLGITTPVQLRLTDEVRSPAVSGFWRPVILLPAMLPAGLSPEGLRTILTHELTHIKRRDPWVSLAQTALQVAYFWHPLVWATNRRLRYLRELAVDETVLVALRSQAQCYTDTLIDIAEMAFRKPAFNLRWIGIAESKRTLERRITHMLNQHISKRPALGWSGLLAILIMGAALVPMGRAPASAQTTSQAVQTTPALPPGIAELFGLSKDSVLEKFGPPVRIFWEDKTYALENLPETYYLAYEGLSFCLREGTVAEITLSSPNYVFGNGIGVGAPEAKVKEAFGADGVLLEQAGESKDRLIYELLGIGFQIGKPDRVVREIDIDPSYAAGTRLVGSAEAAAFAAQLPQKIAALNIDTADLKQVVATFGPPVKYIWGTKTFSPDQLPKRYIAVYPGAFCVYMRDDRIVELRFEGGFTYAWAGKLHHGSTLQEALDLLGAPDKTVTGEGNGFEARVLYRDIDGQKGRDYYHRPDQGVRVWFWDDKVIAIYMTRSDYGSTPAAPGALAAAAASADAEFARLLQGRVAQLNIDTAGQADVIGIFGVPQQYVWGEQTFQPDALPNRYIMTYPCGFCVFMMGNRIMEIRHERHQGGSPYVYRGTLRIGSTIQEAVDLLGAPTETVTGQNEFKDGVLYRDAEGDGGGGYYHRSDQKVRLFFAGGKVIAIYMTRSDFPAK